MYSLVVLLCERSEANGEYVGAELVNNANGSASREHVSQDPITADSRFSMQGTEVFFTPAEASGHFLLKHFQLVPSVYLLPWMPLASGGSRSSSFIPISIMYLAAVSAVLAAVVIVVLGYLYDVVA